MELTMWRHDATTLEMKRLPKKSEKYPEAALAARGIEEAAAAYGVPCEVVNVRQARDTLSNLLDKAVAGSQIVITSDGVPKAMIVKYRPMIHGPKWESLRELRESMPMSPDSTRLLRKLRDSSY
jgi:prevent-host-death family protein